MVEGRAPEIEVFPSTVVKTGPEDAPYAFGFVIPCHQPGLKFICRETYDLNRSRHDHPLGSRFEEMDAVVIFDDVFVPWERVFLYGDPELANGAFGATNAVIHMAHQVINKNIAKTEFLLGLVSLIIDTIAIEPFQHVHEKAAEVIIGLECMRALQKAAEVDAQIDRWGIMTPARGPLDAARNYYPQVFPKLNELIQLLGASGIIMMPTKADREGPMGPHIAKYLQAGNGTAEERLRLFRLAWDMTLSSFGARQNLYEKHFFGDPVRMQCALYEVYDKAPYVERVRSFLDRRETPVTVAADD